MANSGKFQAGFEAATPGGRAEQRSGAVKLIGEMDDFACETWLHRATELPKEGFKSEEERHG
jgi:hypothetical protein